jgi:hypothetical protein
MNGLNQEANGPYENIFHRIADLNQAGSSPSKKVAQEWLAWIKRMVVLAKRLWMAGLNQAGGSPSKKVFEEWLTWIKLVVVLAKRLPKNGWPEPSGW